MSARRVLAVVRRRVLAARERQHARGGPNAVLPRAQLRAHCALDRDGEPLVEDAVDRSSMSARAVHRALRTACTVVDRGRARLQKLSQNGR